MYSFRKVPDSERNIKATLYFGNIDIQATEILMYELFIQFGPVKSLNMPKDRVLNSHQGFGFVEFKTVADAEYTLDILKGIRLFGKQLRLKHADLKSSSSTPLINSSYVDVGAKVFISNLNPMIDSKFLYDTFSRFGTLIKHPEVQHGADGESLGHAFLTFQDFAASDKAIAKMNGTFLMNQKVKLAYAYKEGKKIQHGDEVERKLAENAKKNNVIGKVEKPKRRGKTKRK